MSFLPVLARRRAVIAGLLGGTGLLLAGKARAQDATTLQAALDPLKTQSVKVIDPSGVFLVGTALAGKRILAVGEHGIIIYSDDDGASWTQANVPVNVTLTAIAFADEKTGWAVGNSGAILKTEDAGNNWVLQLTGTQANQLTFQAAQDPSLATSTVPGALHAVARANHFMQGGPSMPFLTLWVEDAQNVTVFGAFRLTMKTQDGGKTWVDWSLHIYDALSHDIYDAVPDGKLIYLVSELGAVLCSNDGGNSYMPLTAAGQYTLFGLLVAPDSSLVVFGVSGSGYRSTDGGKTWNPLSINTSDNLSAGCVLDGKTVIVASQGGTLFKSADNGVTFATIPDLPPMSPNDIREAPDGGLVIAGSGGITKLPAAILNV